jgi:tetratricopeptide (TPR) repeat protein
MSSYVITHNSLHPDLEGENDREIQASKAMLERLILQNKTQTICDEDEIYGKINDLKSSPLLTSIGRMRRMTEIELLLNLENDQIAAIAIDSLIEFWTQERGLRMAQTLQKAEILIRMETQKAWKEAELLFEDCCIQHPQWAEPWYRVSLLYYHQDRLSEALCAVNACLSRKPWHIGGLSHYVRVAEAMHDTKTAMESAVHRFPIRTGKRRQVWIQNAIQMAKLQLEEEEQRIVRVLGLSSSTWTYQRNDINKEIANMDWQ